MRAAAGAFTSPGLGGLRLCDCRAWYRVQPDEGSPDAAPFCHWPRSAIGAAAPVTTFDPRW